MKTKYWIEEDNTITTIHFEIVPDLADMQKAVDDAALIDKTGRRLWLFKAGLNLSTPMLEELALYASHRLKTPSRSALVASDDLSYGILHILEVHRDQDGHEARVFRTQTQAREWLMQPSS